MIVKGNLVIFRIDIHKPAASSSSRHSSILHTVQLVNTNERKFYFTLGYSNKLHTRMASAVDSLKFLFDRQIRKISYLECLEWIFT